MSSDIAADFVKLWDVWNTVVQPGQLDALSENQHAHVLTLANQIRAAGGLEGPLPDPSNTVETYVALAALNEVLGDCHPRSGRHYGAFAHIAARYARTGLLNDPATTVGALLPRWSLPSRPGVVTTRVQDMFRQVIRVPDPVWQRCSLRRPPRLDDLPRSRNSVLRPLRLAFAPLLADIDDLDLQTGVGLPGASDASWYRLGPGVANVAPRIAPLLSRLDESGADIAVLPEGALNPELLEEWKSAIKGVPRPINSNLRWVLAGSGPLPPSDQQDWRDANAAVLLSRSSGAELLRHDKYAPFNFGADQPKGWGLEGVLTDPPPVHEAIWPGTGVSALESSTGRVSVLICEDVTRHGEPPADAAVQLGPNLILVPVFSKELKEYYWEHDAGQRWTTLFGATVAVCNSLVVAQTQVSAHAGPWQFAMLVEADDDPTRWPPAESTHLAEASQADDVRVLPTP